MIKIKKILIIAGCLAVLTAAGSSPVPASEVPARADLEELTIDGEWKDYNLDLDTYAWCPMTMEKDGLLTVTVQTFFDSSHYVGIAGKDYEMIDQHSVNGVGDASPQTEVFSYYLPAGTYYCEVESWNGCQGKFRVKAEAKESKAAEEEPNNSFDEAAPYTIGEKQRGFLTSGGTEAFWSEAITDSVQDSSDFYTFTCEDGNYDISLVSMEEEGGNFIYTLYNEEYEQIEEKYTYETERAVISCTLEKGTYYVKIVTQDAKAGDYTFCVEETGNS